VQVKEFIIRFFRCLNKILDGEESPERWLKVFIILVHKNGNIKHCENGRGLNLLNSGCNITPILLKINHTLIKKIT